MPPNPSSIAGRLLVAALAGCIVLLGACSDRRPGGSTIAGSESVTAAPTPARVSSSVSADERRWATQALQILDTVSSGISQFHDSTAAPAGSAQAYTLRQQAYTTLGQALSAYQQLLPATESMPDTALRDQFTFLMGNVGGFLNPTPDLPGDPPTLGDRIGRSLQNAISTSASLRPKLQQVAGQA
jgi:hypothetical protein